ncbi:MAG: hypothetical protein AAB558_03915 [Patescibacteria group bacterium]
MRGVKQFFKRSFLNKRRQNLNYASLSAEQKKEKMKKEAKKFLEEYADVMNSLASK